MVKIKTRCRIPIWLTFGRISWHVIPKPHCRVLPPAEFNAMIPDLCFTLQGAATGRIQRHVIPEPRITLQGAATWCIHCHDSRATCHIQGSVTWRNKCHDRATLQGVTINSIHHIENRFSHYFILFFNAVWALMSDGFRIVSDTLVYLSLGSSSSCHGPPTLKCLWLGVHRNDLADGHETVEPRKEPCFALRKPQMLQSKVFM